VNLRGFDATAPSADPLDALRDMLQALGVKSQALPESVAARSGLLRSLLSEQQVLVVLDNARDYQQVEPLLPGAGVSRVIITSRNQMPALAVFHQAQAIDLRQYAVQGRPVQEAGEHGLPALPLRRHRRERRQDGGAEVAADPDRVRGGG